MSDGDICKAYDRHNGVKYECHGAERHSGKHFAVKGDGTLHEWANWRAEEPEPDVEFHATEEQWPAITSSGEFHQQQMHESPVPNKSLWCQEFTFAGGQYRQCDRYRDHEGPHHVTLSSGSAVSWNTATPAAVKPPDRCEARTVDQNGNAQYCELEIGHLDTRHISGMGAGTMVFTWPVI